jgi:hypothetical protein
MDTNKTAAILLAALLTACSGDGTGELVPVSDEQAGEADECGRVEAAARSSMVFFDAMGEMGKACASGNDPLACNPANYVIAPLAGVFYAPMGFLIGLFSEDVEQYHCSRAAAARQANRRAEPESPSPIEKTAQFELWRRAASGNANAQYEVGSELSALEDPSARQASRYWFCLAAQQDHAAAQGELGDLRRDGAEPGSGDLIEAYVWYELSADKGDSKSARARADLAREMPPSAVAQAERRASMWQGDTGACPIDDRDRRTYRS